MATSLPSGPPLRYRERSILRLKASSGRSGPSRRGNLPAMVTIASRRRSAGAPHAHRLQGVSFASRAPSNKYQMSETTDCRLATTLLRTTACGRGCLAVVHSRIGTDIIIADWHVAWGISATRAGFPIGCSSSEGCGSCASLAGSGDVFAPVRLCAPSRAVRPSGRPSVMPVPLLRMC